MLPEMQNTFHFDHLNHKSIYLQKFRLYETRSVIVSTFSILLLNFFWFFFIHSTWSFHHTVFSFVCAVFLIMVVCQDVWLFFDLDFTNWNLCMKAFALLLFKKIPNICGLAYYCNICFFTSSMSIWFGQYVIFDCSATAKPLQLQSTTDFLGILTMIPSLWKLKSYSWHFHVCRHGF